MPPSPSRSPRRFRPCASTERSSMWAWTTSANIVSWCRSRTSAARKSRGRSSASARCSPVNVTHIRFPSTSCRRAALRNASAAEALRRESTADLALDVDEAQEFRASAGIVSKCAEHFARHHRYPALVYAARRHALMNGVDDDAYAARLQHVVDACGDLRGELLLDLEAARIAFDHAREFADSDDAVGRQVADVRPSDDGRHVMFAKRLEIDVA